MRDVVRRTATAALRAGLVRSAVMALARLRGHRLVLVYHRVGDPIPPDCEIVPSVPVDMFRRQVQALGEVADLVSLDSLASEADSDSPAARARRPMVALTFDDDLPSHVQHALPILREHSVPAAFFLSGRSLHGLGAYWFQQLETLLIAYGALRTAALLHTTETTTAGLMRACEGNALLCRRVSELAAALPAPPVLRPDAISALAAGGMTIGFHTVDHDVLPMLDEPALQHAVSDGRAELAAATGASVRYFAYPHGRSDRRSAAAIRDAGFRAAFTGVPSPTRAGTDGFRVGRWEPGPLAVDELLVKLAVRIHRTARPRRGGQIA
jgi:peptidoglycan/xylan/chitin deacetylase (PgdA/CDA1 family)